MMFLRIRSKQYVFTNESSSFKQVSQLRDDIFFGAFWIFR